MNVSRTAEWALVIEVVLGAFPLVVGAYQHLLVGFHRFRDHYDACEEYSPNTVVLVPAWNEAAVLGTTIDQLMALDYPRDRLRVYIVDDASTDDTPRRSPRSRLSSPARSFISDVNRVVRARPTRSTTDSNERSPMSGHKRSSSWTPTSSLPDRRCGGWRAT